MRRLKLGNPPNYYVRVGSQAWEVPENEAPLYEGTYSVDLNVVVAVTFVDDLTDSGPPWTDESLPPADSKLRDPAHIRLATLLNGDYVVTPNDALAGRTERFDRPWGDADERDAVVFYVSTHAFAELRADLEDLRETAGAIHPTVRRDDVLDRPVIRLIEDHILTSPWLRPMDAQAIGRKPA